MAKIWRGLGYVRLSCGWVGILTKKKLQKKESYILQGPSCCKACLKTESWTMFAWMVKRQKAILRKNTFSVQICERTNLISFAGIHPLSSLLNTLNVSLNETSFSVSCSWISLARAWANWGHLILKRKQDLGVEGSARKSPWFWPT